MLINSIFDMESIRQLRNAFKKLGSAIADETERLDIETFVDIMSVSSPSDLGEYVD